LISIGKTIHTREKEERPARETNSWGRSGNSMIYKSNEGRGDLTLRRSKNPRLRGNNAYLIYAIMMQERYSKKLEEEGAIGGGYI